MAYRRLWVATMKGRAVKPVLCDQCDCTFVYEIHRRAGGKAEVGALTSDAEARATAQEVAAQVLETQLKLDVEPVPCPRCGHYQPDMVRVLFRRRYGWLIWIGGILATLGLMVSLMEFLRYRRVSLLSALFLRKGAALWLPGAAVSGVWYWLRARFDPNRDAPSRRGRVAPGVEEVPRDQYRGLVEALDRSAVDLGD